MILLFHDLNFVSSGFFKEKISLLFMNRIYSYMVLFEDWGRKGRDSQNLNGNSFSNLHSFLYCLLVFVVFFCNAETSEDCVL